MIIINKVIETNTRLFVSD